MSVSHRDVLNEIRRRGYRPGPRLSVGDAPHKSHHPDEAYALVHRSKTFVLHMDTVWDEDDRETDVRGLSVHSVVDVILMKCAGLFEGPLPGPGYLTTAAQSLLLMSLAKKADMGALSAVVGLADDDGRILVSDLHRFAMSALEGMRYETATAAIKALNDA